MADAVWGRLRPPLAHLAAMVAGAMRQLGMQPPADAMLLRAVVGTLLVLMLSVVYAAYALHGTGRNRFDAVLLVGLTGTGDSASPGKTTLYKTLRSGQPPRLATVPSMDVTEGVFAPSPNVALPTRPDQPVRWVDIPGHARVSGAALEQHLPHARCVVLVVDGVTFGTTARRSAALLHDVLAHSDVRRRATPLLVFANKSDVRGCATPAAVRTRLQAEVERIRQSRRQALADSAGNKDDDALGFDGTPFAFEHTSSPVSFGSGSAHKRDVMAVVNFVRSSFL